MSYSTMIKGKWDIFLSHNPCTQLSKRLNRKAMASLLEDLCQSPLPVKPLICLEWTFMSQRRVHAQLLSRVWHCDPMDCSPPSSSVHGIIQARILGWIAIFFSRVSSWPRGQTRVSCIGRQILYHCATWEALCPKGTKYWDIGEQLNPKDGERHSFLKAGKSLKEISGVMVTLAYSSS